MSVGMNGTEATIARLTIPTIADIGRRTGMGRLAVFFAFVLSDPLCYHSSSSVINNIVLKAVKVRIYPSQEQQNHLAQAFGCVRWVWNQSLATMSQTYKETGKGISAFTMKKQIPVWKTEFEWLKECYSQCLTVFGTKSVSGIYQLL
ncbi:MULTISPECIES: helix-turn-helix domain-containing protein [unclassified Microcoleus]|uniref:helix-turn-helix domain-containing protein n=2 Tax=unclassified Microcoleus TaxID=2642155 RepID=UPI002FCE7DFE